jgi:hypothetical protein
MHLLNIGIKNKYSHKKENEDVIYIFYRSNDLFIKKERKTILSRTMYSPLNKVKGIIFY